jgi:plastocyanin
MRLLRIRVLAVISLLALGSVALAGCGNGDDAEATPTRAPAATATPQAPAASPTPAATNGATTGPINMTIADFSFGPATINARVGQQVQVNLTNAGNLPHNFVIDGLVESATLSGGQTGSAQFTPTQAGTLTFYCSIHGRATMSGTVNVTAGGAQNAPGPNPPAGGTTTGSQQEESGYY